MIIAICDDDKYFLSSFRRVLQDYCAKRDWNCRIHTFSRADQILAEDLTPYHVLFLDIEMPGINGLDTARFLRKKYPEILIVFVTAFLEYAPAGYEIHAFRYLIKENMLEHDLDCCMNDIWKELYSSNQSIEVHDTERTMFRVRLRDVLYLEGTPQRRTIFHLVESKNGTVECAGKIMDYEAKLKNQGFLRIQKSYLVNMWHIEYMSNYNVFMSNGECLKASTKKYQEIRNKYILWRGESI